MNEPFDYPESSASGLISSCVIGLAIWGCFAAIAVAVFFLAQVIQ